MARKRSTAAEISGHLRTIEREMGRGLAVIEACRKLGITEHTYDRWKNEDGGVRLDQVKRLKSLEQEHARLKRLVADLSLDKSILKEWRRDTAQPGPTPRSGPACAADALGVRTPGVSRGRALSRHAAVSADSGD